MRFEELEKEGLKKADFYKKIGFYYGYLVPFPVGWNRLFLTLNIIGIIIAIFKDVFIETLGVELFLYLSLVWIYHGFIKDSKKK